MEFDFINEYWKKKMEGKNLTSVFLLKFKFNSQMKSKLEVLSNTVHINM
jgi:hypothetical protein